MAKVLIIYYSRSGHTKSMAECVERGVKSQGVEVETKAVNDVKLEELLEVDGIIIGSPTYYGTMSAEIKKLLDDSVKYHGKLEGKVGAAFSSSGGLAGGNETTIMDILKAMLIHGMIIQGDPQKDHYGPVSVGKPDERSEGTCERLGERVAQLIKKICKE